MVAKFALNSMKLLATNILVSKLFYLKPNRWWPKKNTFIKDKSSINDWLLKLDT